MRSLWNNRCGPFPVSSAAPAQKVGWLFTVLSPLVLAACGGEEKPPAPPPVPVEVVTLTSTPVPSIVQLPGRIEAVRRAEVRARTDGIVEKQLFEEGSYVVEGTPLFQIDQRDILAQVQSAQAALNRTLAARENAQSVVTRYQPLISERAVSAQEYEAALSNLLQASAQVEEARASLSRAKLQLSYTTVRAPISGRVSIAEVTEGALVSAASGTIMTRIDQKTPVYAVFAESSAAVLDMQQDIRKGELEFSALSRVSVSLEMENGATYDGRGHLDMASTIVDPETGTQTVRAKFDNPRGILIPGQFVRGTIEVGIMRDGLLVPAGAVQMKSEQAMVSVLGKDNVVAVRAITLGALLGENWIVRSGLRAGDRVIVNGWQKVRPGQKAAPMPVSKRPAAASGAPSPAPSPRSGA